MEQHFNPLGQPIGAPLPGWSPRPRPPATPLEGRFCRVEPLDCERHAADLFAANTADALGRDWTYLPHAPYAEFAAYRASLKAAISREKALAHAIIGRASGSAKRWLEPSNFDAEGRQRASLARLRASGT